MLSRSRRILRTSMDTDGIDVGAHAAAHTTWRSAPQRSCGGQRRSGSVAASVVVCTRTPLAREPRVRPRAAVGGVNSSVVASCARGRHCDRRRAGGTPHEARQQRNKRRSVQSGATRSVVPRRSYERKRCKSGHTRAPAPPHAAAALPERARARAAQARPVWRQRARVLRARRRPLGLVRGCESAMTAGAFCVFVPTSRRGAASRRRATDAATPRARRCTALAYAPRSVLRHQRAGAAAPSLCV
jgi:hypothetical protein